ncbi:hypothetical protein KC887_04745 [Candidatus Kaiserbacteria bacterium]|nr:hypothetical protein [Candidatus Kaiserbacteria bacterium]
MSTYIKRLCADRLRVERDIQQLSNESLANKFEISARLIDGIASAKVSLSNAESNGLTKEDMRLICQCVSEREHQKSRLLHGELSIKHIASACGVSGGQVRYYLSKIARNGHGDFAIG